MTGNATLEELLARLAASYDGAVLLSPADLRKWPKAAVSTFKKSKLLTPAAPAVSVVCDGCEQHCAMPVETIFLDGRTATFVACDKRDDMGRIDVPPQRLERWQASGEALAAFLAVTLGIARAAGVATQTRRWEVGRLRNKRTALVVLTIAADASTNAATLILEVAGHVVSLIEVLSFEGGSLGLDCQRLIDCVDRPLPGRAGRVDVATRVASLEAAIEANRKARVQAPVASAMKEAGISRQRFHDMKKTLRKRKAST